MMRNFLIIDEISLTKISLSIKYCLLIGFINENKFIYKNFRLIIIELLKKCLLVKFIDKL